MLLRSVMQKKMMFLAVPLALVVAFSAGKLTQSKPVAVSTVEPQIGASPSQSGQPTVANAAKDPVTEASYLNGTNWVISEVAPLLVDGIEKGHVYTLGDREGNTHVLTVYLRHQNYSSFSPLRQGDRIKLRMVDSKPTVPQGDPYLLNRSDYIRPRPWN